MADVLMIAGKPETIFKARDFEYLVEKHMGYEAAKYFREYAEKADEEVRSAKAGENTDLASYEADLESNHRAFQDIQTEAAVITGVLQEKRINREKIAHAVREIGKNSFQPNIKTTFFGGKKLWLLILTRLIVLLI